MIFTLMLCLSAFLVAGSAAYFSVLGIATLFSGSFIEVMVMAAALELGKLVATSYLHQYWHETKLMLKGYLCVAILVLMAITSLGIFGFLSSAYQQNSAKFAHVDSQMVLLEKQKQSFDKELEQIAARIQTLNESRASQEKRLPNLSRLSAAPIYKDIEKAGEEIKTLTDRSAEIQDKKTKNDEEIIELNKENSSSRDIGTFKFVAGAVDKPLDTVVTWFIAIIMSVFDPLAVALVLAVNVVIGRKSIKKN
jgi:Skp family chaperone for outer membrane proteins